MRIEIDSLVSALSSENGQLDSAMAACQRQVSSMCSALDAPTLHAMAYTAAFDRVRNLRIPLAQAQYVAAEALRAGNDTNISRASALHQTSGGVCDTDEMQTQIANLNSQIGDLSQQIGNLTRAAQLDSEVEWPFVAVSNCESMISMNQATIDMLHGYIEEAERYATDSAGFYADAHSANDVLGSAATSVASFMATGLYGDLSWTKSAAPLYGNAVSRQLDREHAKNNEDAVSGVCVGGQAEVMHNSPGASDVLDGIVTAGSDFVDMNWFTLKSGKNISQVLDKAGLIDGADAIATTSKALAILEKVKPAFRTYAFVTGSMDAYDSLQAYSDSHQDLPVNLRENNAAAEFDIHEVAILIDVYVPFFSEEAKEGYYSFVYTPRESDNRSLADDIYDFRYYWCGGQYGW